MVEIPVKVKTVNDYKVKITTVDDTQECFYVKHLCGKKVIYYGDYYILFKRKNKYFMVEESIWKELKYEDRIESV